MTLMHGNKKPLSNLENIALLILKLGSMTILTLLPISRYTV